MSVLGHFWGWRLKGKPLTIKYGPSKTCGTEPLKILNRYRLPKLTILLQILKRLSSTNFTWFILEYLDPYTYSLPRTVVCVNYFSPKE